MALSLGLAGSTLVAAAGDDGVAGFLSNDRKGCGYFPQFPASSPFVLSVGATQVVQCIGNPSVRVILTRLCSQGTREWRGGGGLSVPRQRQHWLRLHHRRRLLRGAHCQYTLFLRIDVIGPCVEGVSYS